MAKAKENIYDQIKLYKTMNARGLNAYCKGHFIKTG